MFRRSRFSIRPNVGTAGRIAATPQEAPSGNQETNETPGDVSESVSATAVTDDKSVATPSEKATAPGDGGDQNGEGTSSSAAVQRRKRFAIKPKVAPGRPSAIARTPKSPVKAVSEILVEDPGSDLDKATTSSQTGSTATPRGLQSPRRRKPSEDSKQPKVQPKPTLISSESSGPSAVPPAEDLLKQTHLPADSGKQLELESTSESQVKQLPPRQPDKVPPSLPDKQAFEISEKAKTLVTSKSGVSLSSSAFSLSRLLNDPSDVQRLVKAQKLRELLKQERHKEKILKRAKARTKEYTLDPAKMTMSDLIRYLPMTNPLTSSLEDSAHDNETVVPTSPGRAESPERAQEPEACPKMASPREEEDDDDNDEEEEEALMVPQVKVAEDGSLIIDEESLTVEVQRAKGPNPAQDQDPIFERGSTTTYSSFRKGISSKPWSSEETDMFFLAVSMVGTDFSMICQLFPHRARAEIKNKFKKEERENAWRIDKAFRERRKLDIEYFSKLLEKIMEVQKNRKKLKSVAKKSQRKPNKRGKGKKAARKLSDVDEDDEDDENQVPDLEDEGEKENEDLCNEGGSDVSKPKRQCKRKTRQDASCKKPNKKNKMDEKSNEQGEDTEASLLEDPTNMDMSEKADNVNAAKDTVVKPAKLSQGRAPKPLVPLSRKKASPSSEDAGDGTVSDTASKDQVNKDGSPLTRASKRKPVNDDISSEEEDAIVQPPRPTRYGRVPKPTKLLTYPSELDADSSAAETTPTSPVGCAASAAADKPKCTTKRGRSSKPVSDQESKRPKLVILRASQSDHSSEESEHHLEQEVAEEQHSAGTPSKDSLDPVFVPASLTSPRPVISEVEETIEELDILANMPDVLGISQDALCPDASCEEAQNETGTAEPCEHQLDLLVDVIDLLSSEQPEVSEVESYNEAVQTLLTIGNMPQLSQTTPGHISIQDHITGTTSVSANEASQHLEEEVASKPDAQEDSATSSVSAASSHTVTETSEIEATVEPQNSTTDDADMPVTKTTDQLCSEQSTGSDVDPSLRLQSSPESSKKNSPQTNRRRISMVKPKSGQPLRTTQPKSQTETSVLHTTELRHSVAPSLSQVTELLSAPEESTPKIPECTPAVVKNDGSCTGMSLTQEASCSQEVSVGQEEPGASENQSQCISDTQFTPISEHATETVSVAKLTDEKPLCQGEIPENDSHNPAMPATAVTESQVLSQKAQNEVSSACQSRRSRFQRVKPKLNLSQTSRIARSKAQTTQESVDKNSSLTPISKFHEKDPVCPRSAEKPSPASDLISSLDVGSTHSTPAEEMSTPEEKNTDAGSTESPCSNLVTSNSEVTGSQVELGSNVDSGPGQKGSRCPATFVTTINELPVSQKEEGDIGSAFQSGRTRLQHVKPKPTILQSPATKPQTTLDPVTQIQCADRSPESTDSTVAKVETQSVCSSSLPGEPSQSTDPDLVSVPSLRITHKPTEDTSGTEEQETNAGLDSCSESSEPNVLQRRPRFPKVKPNLRSSSRTVQSKVQPKDITLPSEQHHMDTNSNLTPEQQSVDHRGAQSELEPPERDCKHLMETHCSLNTEVLSFPKSAAAELEKSLDSANDKGTSSEGTVIATSWGAEKQLLLTDAVPENKNCEEFTAEAGPALQEDRNLDMSISDVQSLKDVSTESQTNSAYSILDPEESARPCLESNLDIKAQSAAQQCSETNQTSNDKSQGSVDTQSESDDSSISSRKAPVARRGRLIKPKPNLGRRTQPQRVQDITQTEADSGTCSHGVDASGSYSSISELRPDVQKPVEGANEQVNNKDSSNQIASTSNPERNQSHPGLAIFPDLLLEQVPSDPDEPFFILSLTEIPVCSSADVLDSAAEPLSYPSVTDASVLEQSVSGESLAAASGDGPPPDVSLPMSVQEADEKSLVSVKDTGSEPATCIEDSSMKSPPDTCESTTVQSPRCPSTLESSETETPPVKQRLRDTGRRAKLQVKPNCAKTKKVNKTLKRNTPQDSEQLSVLPEASGATVKAGVAVITEPQKGSGDYVETEKQLLTRAKSPKDSSSGAQTQTAKIRVTGSKNSTAPSSDPPPRKAVFSRSRITTPPTAEPSMTHEVTPTQTHSATSTSTTSPSQTQVDIEEIAGPSRLFSDPSPSTSQCAAVISVSQQSDCVESSSIEEEPTTVSQYFLSDIFIEVEEG
ncbi:transcription factor TFIIIB component B'' homolog isoform X2 [Mastacembelus armatus]|uniref:Uncharacterized LOC113124501 n=1 Tax=Mastacembelus armatus TaxID=205130 RepID=A0A3Q3L119_9TELE|nr:transcription factor TFIIIB component B'' homolog isoform X2 [Mastacembelus armatus]